MRPGLAARRYFGGFLGFGGIFGLGGFLGLGGFFGIGGLLDLCVFLGICGFLGFGGLFGFGVFPSLGGFLGLCVLGLRGWQSSERILTHVIPPSFPRLWPAYGNGF